MLCDDIRSYIQAYNNKNIESIWELDRDFPCSNLPGAKLFMGGIEDENEDNPFRKIDYGNIKELASTLSQRSMQIWLKKVYIKSAFQGDSEVYHQDFEYHRKKIDVVDPFHDYIQCFIALTDHRLEGGCLNIFKFSHSQGRIPHELMMTRNGISKLTISPTILTRLAKNNSMVSLELPKGSCVFFSYLTIHGSASNAGTEDQPRMIIQLMNKHITHDAGRERDFWENRRKEELMLIDKVRTSMAPKSKE
jgi:hypothetical protein